MAETYWCGVGGVAVFAGAKQEEESQPGKIKGGGQSRIGMGSQKGGGLVEDLDGDRLHSVGRGVTVGIGTEEPGETWVQGAKRCAAGVWEAHAGEALADCAYFVTYAVSPDRLTTAAGTAIPDTVGQDAEKGNFVADFHKVRGESEGKCVRDPVEVPEAVKGGGALRSDGSAGRRRSSAEVKAEEVSGARGSICQGCGWGAKESRCERSSGSDKSKRREAMSARVLAGPGM
jgi:hypothetical protein